MSQPGNFTPILLYASSTPGNVPLAANLTNSTIGSELAINIADKNLFFKDSGGVVNTVPIRQSSTSSNGWLSSTDWNTFNNKQPSGAYLTAVSVVSANGLAGTSSGGATPALTLSTTVTGILKGNGTAISAATSGTDYAPSTSGSSILYGNGAGGFSNVTIGSGVSFSGGTLSATGSGGTVTSVAALTIGTTGTDLSSTVANGTTTPVITLNVPTASATNRGALSSTDWSTFNGKQAALVSGTNIKTVGGVSLLGSGDVGTIGTGYGGTGKTSFTANQIFYASSSSVMAQSSNLTFDGTILNSTKVTAPNLQGPAVAAYRSTNQSVTTFTPTKISFDTEIFDTNNNFASGTFTPTVAGYYQVSVGLSAYADSTTFSRCFVAAYKNGSEYARFQDIATIGTFITFITLSGSCLIYCNGTTDYIDGYGFVSGTNPGFAAGASATYIQAVLVRSA